MQNKGFATILPIRWKIPLVLCVQAGFLVVIVATFWRQEWQYLQPTPRPVGLVEPSAGTHWQFPMPVAGTSPQLAGKPALLHFFNPGCPCSRFNVAHVRALKAAFGRDVRFVAVLQGAEQAELVHQFRRLDLDIEVICDSSGAIAQSLGVYSTPQAVVLNTESNIFYRGNYNISRYCSDRRTEFARIAIESLLSNQPSPQFSHLATTAYGCQLPSARKRPQ